MIDPSGTVDYTYDSLGRPVKASYSRNGLDINYSYDALGNRTLLTVTRGDSVIYNVYYEYNERDRLTTLTDRNGNTFSFSYDNTGNVTEVCYPNNTKAKFTYDSANRVTSIENLQVTGGNLRSYAYTYDPNGRRTKMVVDNNDTASGTVTYGYDDLGQLIEVADNRGGVNFIYDEVGNRLQMVVNDVYSTDYAYDAANQLLTAGPISYTYDANGNRSSKTTVAEAVYYIYDYQNMLIGINGPSGSVNYTFDGDSQKVSRVNSESGSTYFLLDGETALLEGVTPDFANPTEYLSGINGLLGRLTPEGIVFYYYYDAQGNLGALADEAGNLTDTYAYDPWGSIINRTGSSDAENTYVGKYGVSMEPDDDLLMMGYRFYDATTGTFLQKDPLPGVQDDPTTQHPYMYTRNDPVNKIDPTGENFVDDALGLGNRYIVQPVVSVGKWTYDNVVQPASEKVSEIWNWATGTSGTGTATSKAKTKRKAVRKVSRGKRPASARRGGVGGRQSNQGTGKTGSGGTMPVRSPAQQTVAGAVFGPDVSTMIDFSKNNRKPGKTPPKAWPPLPQDLAGKKPSWNPEGYWEGKQGDHTWDNRSHGSGVDRGNGPQDGHWDDENSDRRWDRNGNPLISRERLENLTGLTGTALTVYIIVSEGSRVAFPPRNLVPVP